MRVVEAVICELRNMKKKLSDSVRIGSKMNSSFDIQAYLDHYPVCLWYIYGTSASPFKL